MSELVMMLDGETELKHINTDSGVWSVLVLQVIGSSSRYIVWIASSSESAYDCSIKPPTISKLGVLGCKIRVHISRSVHGKDIHLYI